MPVTTGCNLISGESIEEAALRTQQIVGVAWRRGW